MWGLILTILSWAHLSPIRPLAESLGTTESALNIIVSLLMGYPLAIFYHQYVIKHEKYRNLYFIITGFDIAFFNFGLTMYHNFIPVVITYVTIKIVGPGMVNSVIAFVVNMVYLLAGYVVTESEDYDITWTMPHCVLTLKLIALSFDLWDGEKMLKGEELSENSKKTALTTIPSFPELIGFVYFPTGFLVGPQFSFRRYSDFLTGKFPLDKDTAVFERQALKKLFQGIIYLLAFQIGGGIFSMKYIQSDEFWENNIFYRNVYCGLWARFALYKYISCWLLTEAACIRIGLSYNGTIKTSEDDVQTKWDGCCNIKLVKFEMATEFQHYIESFNCNTNYFAAEYIYKRLKFLGNRNLSQLFTLLFLAVWHGITSGYYMTFFNEFLIMVMEKELKSILWKTERCRQIWADKRCRYAIYATLKVYTLVFMGWSLVPFDLKLFPKWWAVYKSLYFSGFILFLPWSFVYKPLLIKGIKYFRMEMVKAQ